MTWEDTVVTFEDFAKRTYGKPQHGHRWGRWHYDKKRLTLDYHSPEGWVWDVDLERCNNAKEIINFVLQVAGKTWATSEDVGDLVKALYELSGWSLQETVCPPGRGTMSFKKLLR